MCDTKMIGRDAAEDRPYLATSSEFSKAGEQLFNLQPSSKILKHSVKLLPKLIINLNRF